MSLPTPKTLSVLALALFMVVGFAPNPTADAEGGLMPIFGDELSVASVDLGDGTIWIQPVADKDDLETKTGETAKISTLSAVLQDLTDVDVVRIDGHIFFGNPKMTLDNQGFMIHTIINAELPGYHDASHYSRP